MFKKYMFKIVTKVHVFLYGLTSGKVGSTLMGMPILLLTVVGNKSGKTRTVPLSYMMDKKSYVVVASSGGSKNNPGWYWNLKKAKKAQIQIGGKKFRVIAKEATGKKRSQLWEKVTKLGKYYEKYQEMTPRTIPIMILSKRNELKK